MTTPVWVTGFEHGFATPVTSGGGLCSAVVGSPTVQSTYKHTGSYALRCNAARIEKLVGLLESLA